MDVSDTLQQTFKNVINSTFIYTLTDPKTGLVRYVGKSNNPQKRVLRHIREAITRLDRKDHKNNWVRSLLNENNKPILEIIDEVPKNDWQQWEIYWHNQLKEWGFELTNDERYLGIGSSELTEIQLQKTIAKNKVKKFSEETRKKMSDAAKLRCSKQTDFSLLSNFWKGKKQTAEHIAKRSLKGKKHSEQARINNSIGQKIYHAKRKEKLKCGA